MKLIAIAALTVAAAPGAGMAPADGVADLSVAPAHGRDVSCAACHVTAGWREVTFDHERTGFPLTGAHRVAHCDACHRSGDFGRPLARACHACHRDVHLGRLGGRCDGCHSAVGWREEGFGAEAHRKTDFPLSGRHAVLPCEECHGDRRDRGYSRPTRRCIGCHEVDYGARGSAAGVDHAAFGFGEDCRPCHGPWRFAGGRYSAHDLCFQITRGPHAGIRCRDCHDAQVPTAPGGALSCTSDTADCLRCHTMPGIAAVHASVAGFQAVNRRCYECHRFSGSTG